MKKVSNTNTVNSIQVTDKYFIKRSLILILILIVSSKDMIMIEKDILISSIKVRAEDTTTIDSN
jgi:hypothetical protein